ncbi:MAG TPA: ABC transporter substrate-binding protein [Microlunatus sp.]|nr:ABC transporter substrate-binding protein [Microlunatus sp.]
MTEPVPPLSRRALLVGSLSAALLGGLAACSGGDPAPQPEASPTPVFPTTVTHVYGKTTIEADPQRIVVIGYTEQDVLLALGLKPIATTQWVGDEPYAVFPWAKDELGDAKPTVLESVEGLQVDRIKELEPDLIIGTNSGLTRQDYDALSKVAPTIPNSGASGNDYYEPWTSQTVLVGQAVGRQAQAQKLVDDLTQRFADLAAAHPQFDGITAALAEAPYDDGSVIAWPDGLGTEFLTGLGFTIPESLSSYVSDDVAQAQIPGKDASVMNDAKVIIWGTDTVEDGADIEKDKILGKLDAVKDGRSIYTGEPLTSAIYFSSILSLPYVLDELVPRLEKILPG